MMLKRVMGSEIELVSLQELESKWGPLAESGIVRIFTYIQSLVPYQQGPYFFLQNGGLIYREVQLHIEVATPECIFIPDLILYEKWWEWFLQNTLDNIRQNSGVRIIFHKKSTDWTDILTIDQHGITRALIPLPTCPVTYNEVQDSKGTRGCHENYLVDESLFKKLQDARSATLRMGKEEFDSIAPEVNTLLLFFITRQIISGSGGIKFLSTPENPEPRFYFAISPRVLHLNRHFGQGTTTEDARGIIDTSRDEPQTSLAQYRRFHSIIGDSNMSEWSIFLKFGATQAILEMFESGLLENDSGLMLKDPQTAVRLMKQISLDLTCQNVAIHLASGETLSALEIQERFCQRYGQYLEQLPPAQNVVKEVLAEKYRVWRLWGQILQDLRCGNEESLARKLDWKIKIWWLNRLSQEKGAVLGQPKSKAFDLAYHNIDKDRGVYNQLVIQGRIDHILSPEVLTHIPELGSLAPQQTRAKVRAELIKIGEKSRFKYTLGNLGWYLFSFTHKTAPYFDERSYRVLLNDPFLESLNDIPPSQDKELLLTKYLESETLNQEGGKLHGTGTS